jgi:hypothetical protein
VLNEKHHTQKGIKQEYIGVTEVKINEVKGTEKEKCHPERHRTKETEIRQHDHNMGPGSQCGCFSIVCTVFIHTVNIIKLKAIKQ